MRILHVPVGVFRARLGFVFRRRTVMLEHRGRRSGKLRRTPLEVVNGQGDSFIVSSGTGPDADGYRNIRTTPAVALCVGSRRFGVDQRFLEDTEAATVLAGYEAAHPKAAGRLVGLLGIDHDGTHEDRVRVVSRIPMVELRLRD